MSLPRDTGKAPYLVDFCKEASDCISRAGGSLISFPRWISALAVRGSFPAELFATENLGSKPISICQLLHSWGLRGSLSITCFWRGTSSHLASSFASSFPPGTGHYQMVFHGLSRSPEGIPRAQTFPRADLTTRRPRASGIAHVQVFCVA